MFSLGIWIIRAWKATAISWPQTILFWLACLTSPQCVKAATDILVLQSHDSPPYQQMLTGFQANLSSHKLPVKYDVQVAPLSGGADDVAQIVRNQQPRLIFTIGTPASRAALSAEHKIPIVTGLVLELEASQPNTTGISLAFPASTHWLWLRRLLPEARHIAVIYDPRHGEQLFQSLQQQARSENISLIAAPAQTAEDLPVMLQQLPTQLDALWAVDGVAAFNAVAIRELLLYSFRNRTPLIGLSEQWVKAGALYALDWDYADLGDQAAGLVRAILANGSTPDRLSTQPPRKVRLIFNGKTAEHMKLSFPDRWLSDMTEVPQW
jgi:putative ABC transport system substrate-binding protein